ncbi:AmpG family muropeptide MFS transporter [Gloeobacter violaceus]|uniref:AmpG family muropeptide MFS transporter n=1 Tax=Gloeobacter violaceus TaxID=33072 RepID=UPI0002D81041|nr:AmpG family muropeptide MFS transporter [Gloeobacter violaceus]
MDPPRPISQVFTSRKLAAVLFLGFSSGLPYNLTFDTLQAWMTGAGITLTTIGLFSLARLPYSLKFLWSPVVDRLTPPIFGRRRGWIALMQLAIALVLTVMATVDPQGQLQILAVLAVLLALLSATQDIAFDAYRTDILDAEELGAGAALGVLGYRFALVVTSALAFRLAEWRSWPEVYLWMAALMAGGVLITLWSPEPRNLQPPPSLAEAVRLPLVEFFGRSGMGRGLAILAFIVLYKLGDTLALTMTVPFLKTLFSEGTIGDIRGGVGFVATTLGVLAGGLLLGRIGINRSLWVFGALQAASNLGYFLLALAGKSPLLFAAVVTVENGCAGLGTAAFVAFLMSLCDARYSATQYALLSSLMAVGGIVLGSTTGLVAGATGWPLFFVLTATAAVPGLLLLPLFAPWKERTPATAIKSTF